MIEFFSGSGELAKAFEEAGYKVFKIDNDPQRTPDLVINMLHFEISMLPDWAKNPDVVHFGVPCTKFSVAGRSSNFTNFMPNSYDSCIALALVYKSLDTIKFFQEINPNLFWFIENPMGYLRMFPFMRKLARKEVWYCQYGDTKAKPTDFWTNATWWIPKTCFNNNPNCHHDRAPRGSKSGVQGCKDAYERGIYPKKLCKEIVDVCETGQILTQAPSEPFDSNLTIPLRSIQMSFGHFVKS